MNKELEQKLFDTYPKIFAGKDEGAQENLMCFGCACGDGWYNLIDNLCERLQFLTDRHDQPQVKAFQVKEKFGTLRFYIGDVSVEQHSIISFVEYLSARVCEECGSHKSIKLREGSWIRTLCNSCHNKRNETT